MSQNPTNPNGHPSGSPKRDNRPAVVARGKLLIRVPGYPYPHMIRATARRIVNQDFEDEQDDRSF